MGLAGPRGPLLTVVKKWAKQWSNRRPVHADHAKLLAVGGTAGPARARRRPGRPGRPSLAARASPPTGSGSAGPSARPWPTGPIRVRAYMDDCLVHSPTLDSTSWRRSAREIVRHLLHLKQRAPSASAGGGTASTSGRRAASSGPASRTAGAAARTVRAWGPGTGECHYATQTGKCAGKCRLSESLDASRGETQAPGPGPAMYVTRTHPMIRHRDARHPTRLGRPLRRLLQVH